MRSKIKGPKHGAKTEEKILPVNTKEMTDNLKDKTSDLKDKTSALVKNTKSFNKEYVLLGLGVAFFLVTSIFSVRFAINSKINTAIDTAFEALDSNLIYNGVYIEEVNIGGLTKEQAIQRGISEYAGRRLAKTLTLCYGTYSKDLTYADLGAEYDIKSTVNEAYKIGRSGSKSARIEKADALETRHEYLVSIISINKNKMKDTLKEVAKEFEALNPSGSEVDIDKMANTLEKDMLIGLKDTEYNVVFKS